MPGQGGIAEGQQRLPVQADAETVVDVRILAAIRASLGTNRAGLTESKHRKAPTISVTLRAVHTISHRGLERPNDGITGGDHDAIVSASGPAPCVAGHPAERKARQCSQQNALTCNFFGVSDGIRTHDIQDHNLAL